MTPIDLLIHSILTIICNKTLTAFKGCYMMLQFSSYGAPLWCLGFCFVLFNIDHAFDMAYFLKTANMSHVCLISRKLWTSQIPAYQVRSKPQSKHTIHSILWVRIILKNGCQPVCSTSHKFLSCTWRSSKMLMVLKFFFNLEDVWTRVSTQPLIWTHRSGSLHPKYCLGSQVRYVGLTWALFLIADLFLSGIWQGLYVICVQLLNSNSDLQWQCPYYAIANWIKEILEPMDKTVCRVGSVHNRGRIL